MTPDECADRVRAMADQWGLTPAEFAEAINRLTPEQIASALERCPTDVLEFGVRFEALAHKGDPRK